MYISVQAAQLAASFLVSPPQAECDACQVSTTAPAIGSGSERLTHGSFGPIAPVISDCHQLIQSMAQFQGRSANAEFLPIWENWQHGQQHVMLR